jgi:hypothetical protein
MRKIIKIAIIVCLSIAAVPAALFVYLWLWTWYKTAQVERFYQEHRLLGQMHAVQASGATDSQPAREALLQILPLGMDREAAVGVLQKEGFGCHTRTGTPDNSRTGNERVDCGVGAPSVVAYTNWIVYLEFDANRHLSDARVSTWSIFL